MSKFLFTSESVTEGHPDKICDQISDAILDAILEKDPGARVACETTCSTGLVHIMGEITTDCYVDIPGVARDVIRSIGYDRAKYGFDCDTCGVITNIDGQSPDISQEQLHEDIRREVIEKVIPAELLDENTKYYINPTGRFVVGGPQGDSGLTGRKIIVDTYGGYARHGGGAFSGKDPSKVDRSAAYAARWVAKNVVAAGLATKCEVELAYAIGVAKPVSIMVDTFGTGTVADEKIVQAVEKVFDLTPAAIIRDLDLRKPIYRQLAAYGHMGREDLGVKWENTDRVDALKAAVAE